MLFTDELTAFFIKQCAIKNDDFRKSLPINHVTHEINSFRSSKDFNLKKNIKYKYDQFNGSLVVSNKMFRCDEIHQVLKNVVEYNGFNRDNDPYGEHRFGDITYKKLSFNGEIEKEHLVFWKIEFWDDKSMRWHAANHLKGNSYRSLTGYSSVEI